MSVSLSIQIYSIFITNSVKRITTTAEEKNIYGKLAPRELATFLCEIELLLSSQLDSYIVNHEVILKTYKVKVR